MSASFAKAPARLAPADRASTPEVPAAGRWLGVLACLPLLAACAAEPAGPSHQAAAGAGDPSVQADNAGTGAPMPAIYVDRRVVSHLFDRKEEYQGKLALCRKMPGVTVRALSAQEVAKIEVIRVQTWIKADKAATRWELFDFGQRGQRCHFYLVSEGTHAYHDATRTVSISLEDNVRTASEPLPDYRLQRNSHLSLQEALDSKLQRIKTFPVLGPPQMQSAAGQPCLMWRSSKGLGNYCVWAGGTQWSFNLWSGGPKSRVDYGPEMLHSIVLRQEPGPKNPTEITTTQFVIGADFTVADMMPKPATTSYPGKGE